MTAKATTNEIATWIFEACREVIKARTSGPNWRWMTRHDATVIRYDDAVKFANREHQECMCLDSTHPCEDWCRLWLGHLTGTADAR